MTYVTEIKSVATKEGAACSKAAPALWQQENGCMAYYVSCTPLILEFQQKDKLQPQDTQNEEITENEKPPCLTFLEAVISEFLRQKVMLQ